MRKIAIALILILYACQGRAEQKTTVNVALFHTFSKASSFCYDPYGKALERGVMLAWDDFKKEHPDIKYDVIFNKYDYEDNKLKAIEVVDRAASEGVNVGIGFMCSDFALLGGARAQKVGLPIMTTTATHDDIARLGKYVIMGIYTDDYQAQELAKYAYKDLKKRKTLIISAADCSYCASLSKAYKSHFESLGGNIVGEFHVLNGDEKFPNLVEKVKSQNFDSILIPNYAMQSALIIAELLKSDIATTYLGGDGWTWSKGIHDVINDDRLEGYFVTSWDPATRNDKSAQFLKRFSGQFGEDALGTVTHCYDDAMILYNILNSVKYYDRESIKNALHRQRKYEGVTGMYIYRGKNNYPEKSLEVVKVSNRKQTLVKVINPQ